MYQLGGEEYPALKSLYRTNLPIPSTPFLGRERELGEVLNLLTREDVRLLTLTGPGGTGKTRLAAQAAGALAERYPDGVWWVPLAPLHDPELVLETAARVLAAADGLASVSPIRGCCSCSTTSSICWGRQSARAPARRLSQP